MQISAPAAKPARQPARTRTIFHPVCSGGASMEVSGGTWQQNGEAWNNTVFAYNLSIACNHCIHPKCAGVCPTDAIRVREDGIVVLDTIEMHGLWLLCLGLSLWRAAIQSGRRSHDQVQFLFRSTWNRDCRLPVSRPVPCACSIMEIRQIYLRSLPMRSGSGMPPPKRIPSPCLPFHTHSRGWR